MEHILLTEEYAFFSLCDFVLKSDIVHMQQQGVVP